MPLSCLEALIQLVNAWRYRYSSAPELNDVLYLQLKGIVRIQALEVRRALLTACLLAITVLAAERDQ